MSYIVFARKYRPQAFDEILGQAFIATTLKNAIQSDRIAHAYLFTGPRGIGKTSTARIFAKSLNCEKGSVINPCQKCTSCREISLSISMDVIEIDGASNRGIDEIRNLRENVKFGAIHGKFKIYIIDEVHMLTQEAFNALLKTLEEPPPHVKFIFATTQPHRVPSTILSRCQRFDFRRISNNEIICKLKEIVKNEALDISEEALAHIARASEGSLRDAETILDQLSSFSKGRIKKEDVSEALGTIEEGAIFSAAESVITKDAKNALILVDKLVNDGKDLVQFTSNLIEHARNLLVSKASKDLKTIIDLSPQSIEGIVQQSKHFTIEDLLYIIYLLMNTRDSMKRSGSARIPLEVALVKLTNRGSITSLNNILTRIADLEKRVSVKKEKVPHETAGTNYTEPLEQARPTEPVEPSEPAKPAGPAGSVEPAGAAESAEPAESTGSAQATLVEEDRERIDKIWMTLLKVMRDKKMSVASYLLEGKIHSIDGAVFTIGFPGNYQFHKESLERAENRSLIETSLKGILNEDVRVKFTTFEEKREFKSPATEETPAFQPQEEITEPIIQSAINIFKGKVVKDRKGNRATG